MCCKAALLTTIYISQGTAATVLRGCDGSFKLGFLRTSFLGLTVSFCQRYRKKWPTGTCFWDAVQFDHHAKFGCFFTYCVRACGRSQKLGKRWSPHPIGTGTWRGRPSRSSPRLLSYQISRLWVKPSWRRMGPTNFGDAGPRPREMGASLTPRNMLRENCEIRAKVATSAVKSEHGPKSL